MENQNFFPFGKFLLVVEKTKEEDGKKAKYKTLEKENYAEAFEIIKKHIFCFGDMSLNNFHTLFVEGPEKAFGYSPKDETSDKKEDVFFWLGAGGSL